MSPTKTADATTAEARELAALYEVDETAWLDAMSRLVAERRHDLIDYDHLSEYLSDMARRDRREVLRRLDVLIAHLLTARYQPEKRTKSWDRTILEQRRTLAFDLQAKTLRNHAAGVLPSAYEHARKRAALDTGLDVRVFPPVCPLSLDQILGTVPAEGYP
jgi:hypothetical protein